MNEDIPLPFDLPAVARKKVSAAFDGGRITSDGGVMLLAQAERRLGIADQLARVMPDERNADRVVHLLPDILRARTKYRSPPTTPRAPPPASPATTSPAMRMTRPPSTS
jgi:Transposase DDE domain group 1